MPRRSNFAIFDGKVSANRAKNPKKPYLLHFTQMPPLLHADAFSYIAQGICVAHADYPHQQRKAFLSTMQTISITRAPTTKKPSVSRITYHLRFLHCCIAPLLYLRCFTASLLRCFIWRFHPKSSPIVQISAPAHQRTSAPFATFCFKRNTPRRSKNPANVPSL